MIELYDLTEIVGYIIGSFAFGYASGWLFYLFRKVIWNFT